METFGQFILNQKNLLIKMLSLSGAEDEIVPEIKNVLRLGILRIPSNDHTYRFIYCFLSTFSSGSVFHLKFIAKFRNKLILKSSFLKFLQLFLQLVSA